MVLMADLLFKRAENEITTAEKLKRMSEDSETKMFMEIPEDVTFYSAVISHDYYAVFYSAKAYLLSRDIPLLSKQGQHQQVYFEFRKLVKSGIVDVELLEIYEDVKGKAEALLEILKTEKDKRTNFVYETIPQANKQPAEDSLKNAVFFVSHIKKFLSKEESSEEDEKETEKE
jgi:uncharacterized protein (UPF0332 family)